MNIKINLEDILNIQSSSSKEYPLKPAREGDYIIPFIYMWEHLKENAGIHSPSKIIDNNLRGDVNNETTKR